MHPDEIWHYSVWNTNEWFIIGFLEIRTGGCSSQCSLIRADQTTVVCPSVSVTCERFDPYKNYVIFHQFSCFTLLTACCCYSKALPAFLVFFFFFGCRCWSGNENGSILHRSAATLRAAWRNIFVWKCNAQNMREVYENMPVSNKPLVGGCNSWNCISKLGKK